MLLTLCTVVAVSLTLLGSGVYRMIIAHDNLTAALSIANGYSSNSVDPKPYLHKAQLDIGATMLLFLKDPFNQEFQLVYVKRGFIVCRATLKPGSTRWYLEIPDETLWWKQPKPEKNEVVNAE